MSKVHKLIFPKDGRTNFYFLLKERVTPIIIRDKRKVAITRNLKLIVYPLLCMLIYYFLLHSRSLLSFYFFYAMMGLMLPVVVLNIVHDAVHKCLFENQKANKIAACMLDLMGGNSYVWSKRHVQFHHTYPNIPGWDVDLESKKFFRLAPTDPVRKAFRFQHFYMPVVYLLFTFHWLVFRDFKDYFQKSSMFRRHGNVASAEYAKLILFKLFYFSYIIAVPALVLPFPWYDYLLAFLLLHAVASFIALMIILPNHWDEHAEFRFPDDAGQMPESWALHQLITTNDFGTRQPVFNMLFGCLNHHVAHHLFPSLAHTYLPAITREVVKIAKEQSLPYKCFSFGGALSSHFRLLKNNGFDKNILNEDML